MTSRSRVAAFEDRGPYPRFGQVVQEPERIDRRGQTVCAGRQSSAAGPSRRHARHGSCRDGGAIDGPEHHGVVQGAPLASYLHADAADTALSVRAAQHRQPPRESITPGGCETSRNPTHARKRGYEQQRVR